MARILLRPSLNRLVRPDPLHPERLDSSPLWVDGEGRTYCIEDSSPAALLTDGPPSPNEPPMAFLNDKKVDFVVFNDWEERVVPRQLLVWVAAQRLFEVRSVRYFDRLEPDQGQ